MEWVMPHISLVTPCGCAYNKIKLQKKQFKKQFKNKNIY